MFYEQFREESIRHGQFNRQFTVEGLSKVVARQATREVAKGMKSDTYENAKAKRRMNQEVLAKMQLEAEVIPQCPPGYKFNKKNLRCEPISPKHSVTGNGKDSHPQNGPGYGVIGSHGMNGEPYAYEESPEGGGDISEGKKGCGNCGKSGCGCNTYKNTMKTMRNYARYRR